MDAFRQPHHALENEYILEAIFEQLLGQRTSYEDMVRDIANVRLVCHVWRHTMTLLARRLRPMLTFSEGPPLRRFIETMANSSLVPVRSIKLEESLFEDSVDSAGALLFRLLSTCAESISSLVLRVKGEQFENFDPSAMIPVQDGPLVLASLDVLDVRVCYPDDGSVQRGRGAASMIGSLLCSSPNLDELRVSAITYAMQDSRPTEIALGEIICGHVGSRVSILIIKGLRLIGPSFQVLSTRGLSLKLLWFEMDSVSDEDVGLLRGLLDSVSTTLSALMIYRHSAERSTPLLLDIPALAKLEALTVAGIGFKTPASIATMFPRLEKLDIGECDADDFGQLFSRTKRATSLTSFSPPMSRNWRPQLVRPIAQKFPSLIILELASCSSLRVLSHTMHQVFTHLSTLQRLHLSVCEVEDERGSSGITFNLDSLLTGMSVESCKRISMERRFRSVNLQAEQTHPSLHNLARLKTLDILSLPFPHQCRVLLTDVVAHFAFLRMPRLANLRLPASHFSCYYVRRLRDRLQHLYCYSGDGLLAGPGYEDDY